ncbi:hypothetical protein [Psychrobacter sp. WY6]|uniref:hypothetical protein n=1 Tax=Psychrobacter sp. WY6 TaxID=2708350 RepID=UPI002022FD32|nr:hypothetical protein [Psychrobacter sp. WY6]
MSQLLQNNDFVVGHLTPNIVLYEPSFEGWLSAVYVYADKLQDDESLQLIAQDCYVPSLIAQATSVTTDEDNAERVLVKLNQLLGRSGMRNLLWGFCRKKIVLVVHCFKWSNMPLTTLAAILWKTWVISMS